MVLLMILLLICNISFFQIEANRTKCVWWDFNAKGNFTNDDNDNDDDDDDDNDDNDGDNVDDHEHDIIDNSW